MPEPAEPRNTDEVGCASVCPHQRVTEPAAFRVIQGENYTMAEPIILYSVSDEPIDKETLSAIVSRMISAGYRPINCVPRQLREKSPYMTLHFIARFDVPNE